MSNQIKFEVGRIYECASLMQPGNVLRFEVVSRTKVRVTLREVNSGKILNNLGLERTVPHEAEQLYPLGRRVGRPVLSAANVVELPEAVEKKQENEVKQ